MTGARIAIPLVLLAAGIVELVITIHVVTRTPSAWTLTAMNLPSSFLPITLAVIFATFVPAGKVVRAVIAIAAIGFAGVRLGLVVTLFVARPDADQWLLGVVPGSQANQISLGISVVTGTLMGLALAMWSCLEWVRPAFMRRIRTTQSETPVRPAPVRQPLHPESRPHRDLASTATWHESATPWPRRVEEDSDGTLIRPPQITRRG